MTNGRLPGMSVPSIPARQTLLLAAMILLFNMPVTEASANGWEHTAVPVETLLAALTDTDHGIRAKAAHSLGYHRGNEVAEALIQTLAKEEPVAAVRQAIYRSLGKIANPLALSSLESCIRDESQQAVRVECAESLAAFPQSEAERIVQTAVGDSQRPVRLAAIGSLGNFQTAGAINAVNKFLQDPDTATRQRAARAAAMQSDPASMGLLLSMLAKGDDAEKIAALKALATRKDPVARAAIENEFADTSDPRIKRYAFIARAAINAGDEYSILQQALADEDPLLKLHGLEFARERKLVDTTDTLVELGISQLDVISSYLAEPASDKTQQTQVALTLLNEFLRTVISIDPAKGFDLLSGAAGLNARSAQGDLTIAEGLYRARWQGIYGIGYTGDTRAEALLRDAVNDADARIRAAATRSMGVFGPQQFRDSIGRALEDPAAEVRWTAASVLGRDPSSPHRMALIGSLEDSHAGVRREAALSLGYLGALSAVNRLRNLVKNDPDQRVQAAASFALRLLNELETPGEASSG